MSKPDEKLRFIYPNHSSDKTQEQKTNEIIQEENNQGYRLVNIDRSESSAQGPDGLPNRSETTILHFRKIKVNPADQQTKILEENLTQISAEIGSIATQPKHQ